MWLRPDVHDAVGHGTRQIGRQEERGHIEPVKHRLDSHRCLSILRDYDGLTAWHKAELDKCE